MGIFDIFTGDSAKKAAEANANLYSNYGTQSQGYIDQYQPLETGAVNSGIGAYQPLANLGQQYSQAGTMLNNALGVNGAAGNAAATSAFQAAPGYQFALNQAIDQTTRAGNAMGATGNTMDEVANRSAQYANQNYNNWIGALGAQSGQGLTATAGAANGQQTGYDALAGIYGQNASDRIGIAGNVASGTANSNTAAANSQMQASGNFWNGLMSLGGNIAKGAFSGGLSK